MSVIKIKAEPATFRIVSLEMQIDVLIETIN